MFIDWINEQNHSCSKIGMNQKQCNIMNIKLLYIKSVNISNFLKLEPFCLMHHKKLRNEMCNLSKAGTHFLIIMFPMGKRIVFSHIFVCLNIWMHVHIYAWMYVRWYVGSYVGMLVCMCACMYVGRYICMSVCATFFVNTFW